MIEWKKFEDERPRNGRAVLVADYNRWASGIYKEEDFGFTHWAYVNLPHEEGREYTPEVENEG